MTDLKTDPPQTKNVDHELLDRLERILEQAQDCIKGETAETMSDEAAREDTISKVREGIFDILPALRLSPRLASPAESAEQWLTQHGDGSVSLDAYAGWSRDKLKDRCRELCMALDEWRFTAISAATDGSNTMENVREPYRSKIQDVIDAYDDEAPHPRSQPESGLRQAVSSLFDGGFIDAGTRLTIDGTGNTPQSEWAQELETRLKPIRAALNGVPAASKNIDDRDGLNRQARNPVRLPDGNGGLASAGDSARDDITDPRRQVGMPRDAIDDMKTELAEVHLELDRLGIAREEDEREIPANGRLSELAEQVKSLRSQVEGMRATLLFLKGSEAEMSQRGVNRIEEPLK